MSDGVPTLCMSFFCIRQRGQGLRPRFLIVARRILIFHEYYTARQSIHGFGSLFRIVRRVCDYASEENSLDAIGALDHKSLSASLDEFLIHQVPP
jgi:hypothetical protein